MLAATADDINLGMVPLILPLTGRPQRTVVSDRIFSFIVKIWIDDGEERGCAEVAWHGLVTEVPGGDQRYVNELSQMSRIR